jgi:hypothetical protein
MWTFKAEVFLADQNRSQLSATDETPIDPLAGPDLMGQIADGD